jgi:uncharacterized membrane protein YfcA
VLASLPGLFLGIYFGNKIFLKISEKTFRRLVGTALLLIAVQQIFSTL